MLRHLLCAKHQARWPAIKHFLTQQLGLIWLPTAHHELSVGENERAFSESRDAGNPPVGFDERGQDGAKTNRNEAAKRKVT
jgi:hypothetical protein